MPFLLQDDPGGHSMHVSEPKVLTYVPFVQGIHADFREDPASTSPYLPAGHLLHIELFHASLYVPAEDARHSRPLALKVPGGHP